MFLHPIEGDAPLSAEVALTLGEVCASHGGPCAPDRNGYFFDLRDGSAVELYAGGARAGGLLSLRRWGPAQADFVFDILDRTGWLFVIPTGSPLPVLSARQRDSAAELVGELEHTVHVVKSSADVLRAMASAFGQWADFRDQIVKG